MARGPTTPGEGRTIQSPFSSASNGQGFNQSCTYNEASINENPKGGIPRGSGLAAGTWWRQVGGPWRGRAGSAPLPTYLALPVSSIWWFLSSIFL